MSAEIYLIVPGDAADLPQRLPATLAATEVAALLLTRSTLGDAAYRDLARKLVPIGQAAGAAVILEGEPALVRTLGADGLHVSGGAGAARAAIAALKPDLIVGAGGIGSRHDAMQLGELGIDYVQFGPLSGSIPADQREMAQWWAQTMEVPSVLSDPQATLASYDAAGCEFIGLTLDALERDK